MREETGRDRNLDKGGKRTYKSTDIDNETSKRDKDKRQKRDRRSERKRVKEKQRQRKEEKRSR